MSTISVQHLTRKTRLRAITWKDEAIILSCAVTIALAVRSYFILQSEFPLNDGGMFYIMVRDLQSNAYMLPEFTTYNQASIPFAYPPLAFYLAALMDDLLPFDLIEVFRLLPLLLSVSCVVAFYQLVRSLCGPGPISLISVFLFAVSPKSVEWFIMGGGLTRSLGFLFALSALAQIQHLTGRHSLGPRLVCAVFCTATVFSHLQMSLFLVVSACVFWFFLGRTREMAWHMIQVGCGTLLLTAIWWVPIIQRHGLHPFLHTMNNGGSPIGSVTAALAFGVTGETVTFPVIGSLALLGSIIAWARGERMIPSWLWVILVFSSRGAENETTVPLAVLAAVGVVHIVPLFYRTFETGNAGRTEIAASGVGQNLSQKFQLAGIAVSGFAFAYLVLGSVLVLVPSLRSLDDDHLSVMSWLREQTQATDQVIVISGRLWAWDAFSEWLPAIADRRSIATAQGYEWHPNFPSVLERHSDLQSCATEDATCISDWALRNSQHFDYLAIERGEDCQPGRLFRTGEACTLPLLISIESDPRYVLRYVSDNVSVYSVR